ncbi:MAG: YiiX/YebB-like N1pC/P60 family cysteine hydrolase [Myxococcota bacterium]
MSNRKLKLFLILFIIIFAAGCKSRIHPSSLPAKIQKGDFIFQKIECGDLCTAIAKSTARKGYPEINHVAVVDQIEPEIVLIEAYKKVKRIKFAKFVERSVNSRGKAKILAGRVIQKYRGAIPFVLAEIRARLEKPYDKYFLPDNGAYYCSELIADSFAAKGYNIFPRHPMSFGEKSSKSYRIWKKYFAKLGTLIPQGKPGTNPIQLLDSKAVKIYYNYKAK